MNRRSSSSQSFNALANRLIRLSPWIGVAIGIVLTALIVLLNPFGGDDQQTTSARKQQASVKLGELRQHLEVATTEIEHLRKQRNLLKQRAGELTQSTVPPPTNALAELERRARQLEAVLKQREADWRKLDQQYTQLFARITPPGAQLPERPAPARPPQPTPTPPGPPPFPGQVQTVDGQAYVGNIQLRQNAVTIQLTNGTTRQVRFDQLRLLQPTLEAAAPTNPAPAPHGVLATYFATRQLRGKTITRLEPNIDFDWKTHAPAPGLPAGDFSCRWEGQLEAPASGKYVFRTLSNDGVRLWIDGKLIINQWNDHGNKMDEGSIDLAAGQRYGLKMEHYQNTGTAVAKLFWNPPGQSQQIVPANRLFPPSNASAQLARRSTASHGLLAAYFKNRNLQGQPVTRVDPAIDFDWKSGGPMPGVGPDNFSVRWLGQIAIPKSGKYTFRTQSNDGVRLWVDGRLIIDQWNEHSSTSHSGSVQLDGGRKYALKMEHFEARGTAVARLSWTPPGRPGQTVPEQVLYLPDDNKPPHQANDQAVAGLLGTYFKNQELRGPSVVRLDATIDFDWHGNAPIAGIGQDNFSIRWVGQLRVPRDGDYTFFTRTDDGVRLWIDGRKIIDAWRNQSVSESKGRLKLKAGKPHDLRLEYFESSGEAVVKLLWQGPSIGKATLPSRHLFPQLSDSLLAQYAPKPAGVVLTDGSFLAGSPAAANPSELQFANTPNAPILELASAARLRLQPVMPEQLKQLPANEPGLLLQNGRFVPGTFQGLDADRVTIQPGSKGAKSYDRAAVQVVALRSVEPKPTRLELETHTHWRLRIEQLEIQPQGLLVHTPAGARFHLPVTDIAAIRAVNSQVRPD